MFSNSIGLVLSGGGMRGVAHLGVIKALEELGISPSYISGASAGALVGAFYAAGYKNDEALTFFRKTASFSLRNYTIRRLGIIKTERFYEDFKTYFPDDTFDFENKKLFVTVTDIIQGEVHYLESGSLIQALLASASFPGVFAPIKKGNLVLADGGIANNFPVEPLLNSCSKIIGVYVNPLKKIDSNKLKTAYAVMNRSFAISRNMQSVKKFSDCDIVICPTSLSRFSLFNLHHIDELFEIGYQATMDKKKDLFDLFSKM
jgi:NTE family protein